MLNFKTLNKFTFCSHKTWTDFPVFQSRIEVTVCKTRPVETSWGKLNPFHYHSAVVNIILVLTSSIKHFVKCSTLSSELPHSTNSLNLQNRCFPLKNPSRYIVKRKKKQIEEKSDRGHDNFSFSVCDNDRHNHSPKTKKCFYNLTSLDNAICLFVSIN